MDKTTGYESPSSTEAQPTVAANSPTMVPMAEVLKLLGVATASATTLTPLQKRITMQYLAIRNAHGDFGGSQDRAFFESPELVRHKCDSTLTIRQYPNTTAAFALLKAGGGRIGHPRDAGTPPQEIPLSSDEADMLVAVEAIDVSGARVGIAIPRRT